MRNFRMAAVLGIAAVAGALHVAVARAEGPATVKKGDPVRLVEISGDDTMKFSVTNITARRGERIRLRFVAKGKMPKIAMAHNVVVLKAGTDVEKFVASGLEHRPTDFIAPEFASSVIAKTAMAGPGEMVEVTFTAPANAGSYPFVCTFAGHYQAGMKGTLVVK